MSILAFNVIFFDSHYVDIRCAKGEMVKRNFSRVYCIVSLGIVCEILNLIILYDLFVAYGELLEFIIR